MHFRAHSDRFRDTTPPVSPDGRYRPVSFWQETVTVDPGEPLRRDIDCDVAVIGGGFTGLSTAYELKRAAPQLDVVVLEHAVVGHGASGRNGGFVMPLLGWSLRETTAKLGEEQVTRAYRVMYQAIDHTLALIRDQGIDCDLEQTGYLLLATCAGRAHHVREEAELGARLGFDYRYLQGAELERYVRSERFRAACFDPRVAIVNPAKLAAGLAARVRQLGVEVYQQSPIEEIDVDQTVLLRTRHARVHARAAVLAVNAYAEALGFMTNRILPVHTYIILTEPIDDRRLEEIGWKAERASLETARNFIHYFRLTADNRILFGGHDAKLFWNGRLRDDDQACFDGLERTLRRFFPSLGEVAITHRWGGPVAVTLDMLPSFGVTGVHRNLFYAGGYSGHGVALANYAGRILAPRVLAQLGLSSPVVTSPVRFGRKPPPLGPDPLRFLGMQIYRLALHAQDRLQRA